MERKQRTREDEQIINEHTDDKINMKDDAERSKQSLKRDKKRKAEEIKDSTIGGF